MFGVCHLFVAFGNNGAFNFVEFSVESLDIPKHDFDPFITVAFSDRKCKRHSFFDWGFCIFTFVFKIKLPDSLPEYLW